MAEQRDEPAADAVSAPGGDRQAAPADLTIDELAARTQVPSRTIRFYQSKGALPRPEIRGRVAYYGPAHIERLRLIADLKDRGLTIRAIRDLVQRIERGELDLDAWLGLEESLKSPWAEDRPVVVDARGLDELLGASRPGLVANLLEAGLIARERDSFLVRSPALARLTVHLEGAGVSFDVAIRAGEILRKHLARAAEELVEHFAGRAGKGFGREITPDEIRAALEALRPVGHEAIRLLFSQEIERVLSELVRSGRVAEVSARSR